MELEAAADDDGVLLGLRARIVSDAGAYHIHPLTQALEPFGTAAILPGPYRTPAYAYECMAIATNKPPLGAYRGVGMAFAAFVMERTLDLLADRLRLDPAEIRRRNLISRDAYPFTSAGGFVYDSGDLPKALEQALDLAGYDRRGGAGGSSASGSLVTRNTPAWARRPTDAAAWSTCRESRRRASSCCPMRGSPASSPSHPKGRGTAPSWRVVSVMIW